MGNPFLPRFEALPAVLPVFPLTGVLLLPRGLLPLNIFEPRYLAMVDEAMRTSRLVGMIQGREDGNLYDTGCAGRITEYEETDDGRYQITLTGVSRFKIVQELAQQDGFRRVKPSWEEFRGDLDPPSCVKLDRPRLTGLLKTYFQQNGLTCAWEAVDSAPDEKLITCLAMICPLKAGEKQALLEAQGCAARAELFMAMLEMAVSARAAARH